MSSGDRLSLMERKYALENARNMLYSKVGKVVLEENKFPDRALNIKLKDIDRELRKNQMIHDNSKKMFKRGRLINNLEPTIVMERPGSPKYPRNADVEMHDVPHYMTDIKKANPISHSPIPTIDAFVARTKKKRNLWEADHVEQNLSDKFRSIIMKSPPLTELEEAQLQKNFETFRPVSRMQEEIQQRVIEKKRIHIELLKDVQRSDSPDGHEIFITQLNQATSHRSESRSTRRSNLISRLSNRSARQDHKAAQIELTFNQSHMTVFEKIRKKQQDKHFKTMKFSGL